MNTDMSLFLSSARIRPTCSCLGLANASDATDLKVLAEVLADALKNFEIFLKSKGI